MWYDRYKKEQLFVQRGEGHSKFWAGVLDEQTNTVTIRWGRIGTKGQQQVKTFGSPFQAAHFLEGKVHEKTGRKGYLPITKPDLDKLCIEAAIVGSQNKCNNLQWVALTRGSETGSLPRTAFTFEPVDASQLMQPDCDPGLLIDVETRKDYDGQNRFQLLFTFDQVFKRGPLSGPSSVSTADIISTRNQLYELTKKVEEAVGRSLAS